MAQERLGDAPDLDMREAEEIERLLKEDEERRDAKIFHAHPLNRFLTHRQFLGLLATVLLLWIGGWGVLSLMEESPQVSQVPTMVVTQAPPVQEPTPSIVQIQKPNIYPLEPFFVPIRNNNKETGKFLHVTANLVLSNRRLRKDIDKVQPLIRQGVYTVISRKKSKDFEKSGFNIEEKIKREILTSSNSFLLSGTGTITNIIFTEFMISSS